MANSRRIAVALGVAAFVVGLLVSVIPGAPDWRWPSLFVGLALFALGSL